MSHYDDLLLPDHRFDFPEPLYDEAELAVPEVPEPEFLKRCVELNRYANPERMDQDDADIDLAMLRLALKLAAHHGYEVVGATIDGEAGWALVFRGNVIEAATDGAVVLRSLYEDLACSLGLPCIWGPF
jgi:hypothetical protein